MFLRDKSVSSPWLPGGHRWSNSSWATPCDRFGKPKANPSSLQRRLGGPATIPRLAQPVTTHKVPAWTTFLGIALFGLALFCLHHLLAQYHWRDILGHVHAISTGKLLQAGRFPPSRYGCFTLYAALALHFAAAHRPHPRAAVILFPV